MRRFDIRAEFRRQDRGAPWVLAAVLVDDEFFPTEPGVEPIRRRLPAPGLVGWVQLDPVLARSVEHAAEIALQVCAARWPERRAPVPHR